MRGSLPILLVVALLAAVPLITSSNVVLNFLVMALLIALVGQGWNVLGGYGGQYSFGHAAFFGTGAYVTAILQVRYGVNAWVGLAIGIAAGALVGAVIGALSFRSGLKGSYFALVTLAFAEVLRIVASVAPITGAGVGTLIKLDLRPEAFQFQSRAPFYWIILALVAASLVLVQMIEASRFGAYLVAVRENEDAARALGVDATLVKLGAMTISAAITAAGGCFYAQYFLFIDAGIAYGPWISVEALLAPIIGGIGTVFGPLLGALVVKTLGELTKLVTGDAPGLDLVIYGVRADPGGGVRAARHRRPVRRPARSLRHGRGPAPCRSAPMAEPLLRVEAVSKRFGGLLAVDQASFTAEAGRITALIGPNGAGKTTLFAIITGFLPPSDGRIFYDGDRHHRRAAAPARAARHRAHLPDRAAVRRPDRAREHRGRRASVAARRAPTRSPRPPRSRARSGSATCSTVRPRASRWPAASGSSSRARSPSSRGCCCSTRCWPASIRPRSATWCR